MADDTPEHEDGHVVTDSRVEDTEVDSSVDGSDSHVPAASVSRLDDHGDVDIHSHRVRNRKPRRRWPWVVALVLMTGVLATSITMTYQASQVAEEWSDQVDAATAANYALGQDVADSRAENVSLNDQIDLLEEQLSNSKDTVLKLSDEKAQWRDDTEFAQQQTEATEAMVTQATDVANSLQRCTDGQVQLLDYISNADTEAEDYDPTALDAYRESVTELCTNAQEANTELQEALAE